MIFMLLKEIVNLMENKLSPKIFSLSPDIYGIQYGNCQENRLIKKIMLTMDLSLEAIHDAIKKKVNLIISYNGLVDKPITKFKQNLVNKLSLLSRTPITIFVLGSSFIAAEEGVSDTMAEKLYLKIDRTFNIRNRNGISIPLGRICIPMFFPEQNGHLNLEKLIKRIKANFDMKHVFYVGDLNNEIKKIAIMGGENSKQKFLKMATRYGCDCYISGRFSHRDAIFAKDIGLNLIEASYYNNIFFTLKKLSNFLSLEFPEEAFYCYDSNNPFNYC